MGKFNYVIGVVLGLAFSIVAIFFVLGITKTKAAGILIETTPTSTVFINGERVGQTPYSTTTSPGGLVIKLVPDSTSGLLAPYETKLSLTAGVKTVVRRVFGKTEDLSSGEIVSFEKTGDPTAVLSIVSSPDAAQVMLDGQPQSFTPIKISRVVPGEHLLTIRARGFVDKTFSIKAVEGYKLTVVAKLAVDTTAARLQAKVLAAKAEAAAEMVEILDTPTGFLRVRAKPTTLSKEVGRADPGKEYKLVEFDEKSGWFRIELPKKINGWVSGTYAQKVGDTP